MAKGSMRNRSNKIVTSHSTHVPGLMEFLDESIIPLDEVVQIRPGRLQHRNAVGRKSKKRRTTATDDGFPVSQAHKRADGGGGFRFRATRWAQIGSRITGIKCDASKGTLLQEVVLIGPDLEALRLAMVQLDLGGRF